MRLRLDLEKQLRAYAGQYDREFTTTTQMEQGIVARIATTPREARQAPTLRRELGLAALVLLFVALLVVGFGRIRALQQPVPARPTPSVVPSVAPSANPSAAPASALCGTGSSNDAGLHPVKMLSPSIGWASGALRTTDGGANWLDVSPPSLPYRAYGDAEFYLDANHAWIAQTAGSKKACADQVVVSRTSDGGRTWQQAAPIAIKVVDAKDVIWSGAGTDWMYFIDAQTGWLLVESGPYPFMADLWRVGALYKTTDGGLHWTLVSTNSGFVAGCRVTDGMSFASATTGWIREYQLGSDTGCPVGPGLLVTHDGGVTWELQRLPVGSWPGGVPVFFDKRHGILTADGGALLVTSDGGSSWTTPRHWPGVLVDFIDTSQGWAIDNTTDQAGNPSVQLYHTSNGGVTWTPVRSNLPPRHYGPDWSLNFVDAKNGFLSTGVELLSTADGGHSWTILQAKIQRR